MAFKDRVQAPFGLLITTSVAGGPGHSTLHHVVTAVYKLPFTPSCRIIVLSHLSHLQIRRMSSYFQ
jgi:hypothetical protein